jgi:nucleotide-binding universal stress UspA family protein
MLSITTILCATDFSECSRRAAALAVSLARATRAHVVALHVGDQVLLYPAVVAGVEPARVPSPSRAERTQQMARLLAPISDPHCPIDILLEEGDVPATIVRAAAREHADLIVMGTHGRSGFRRLALGSVAAHVVHTAARPVLVVPPWPAPMPAFAGFTRIVCPASNVELGYAHCLAEGRDSHIEVVPAGDCADEILRAAAVAEADLIVWRGSSRVIDEVVCGSRTPVLAVHAPCSPAWARAAAKPGMTALSPV